jgi:DNA (cytosine-5)-methyltransferase 1
VVYNGENITHPLNKTNPQPGDSCHTLGTDSRNYVVCCIDGDKIGKAERAGGSGLGIREGDKMYTLTAKDAGTHGVCYGIGNGQVNQPLMEEKVGALNCMHDQQAVCYGVDCRNATEYPELNGTLQAKPGGGTSLNCNQVVRIQYIVRRLTPTECARLQGFADGWAIPDKKTEFTDEEYRFWLNVRNTHAEINGKPVKSYTRDQMLTWYNKLHTDSSEYKLWGNGIALPCALYMMQGISDVLK